MITDEQISAWHALQGEGMISSVGEYTPDEFWDLLSAYEEMRKALAVYGKWMIDVATLGELGDLERRMNAVGISLQKLGEYAQT